MQRALDVHAAHVIGRKFLDEVSGCGGFPVLQQMKVNDLLLLCFAGQDVDMGVFGG